MKKALGYIFYGLAIVLIIAVVGLLGNLISAVIQVLALFTNEFDSSKFGYAFGHLIYWTLHFTLIIILLKYAKKWTTKTTDKVS